MVTVDGDRLWQISMGTALIGAGRRAADRRANRRLYPAPGRADHEYPRNIDRALLGRSGPVARHVLATPGILADALAGLDLGRAQHWKSWLEQARSPQARLSRIPDYASLPDTADDTAHMTRVIGRNRRPAAGRFDLLCRRRQPLFLGAAISAYACVPQSAERAQRRSGLQRAGGRGRLAGMSGPAHDRDHRRRRVRHERPGDRHRRSAWGGHADHGHGKPPVRPIRVHQERHFPGRVSGTQLVNPDLAALARAYGAHGRSPPPTRPRPRCNARWPSCATNAGRRSSTC